MSRLQVCSCCTATRELADLADVHGTGRLLADQGHEAAEATELPQESRAIEEDARNSRLTILSTMRPHYAENDEVKRHEYVKIDDRGVKYENPAELEGNMTKTKEYFDNKKGGQNNNHDITYPEKNVHYKKFYEQFTECLKIGFHENFAGCNALNLEGQNDNYEITGKLDTLERLKAVDIDVCEYKYEARLMRNK